MIYSKVIGTGSHLPERIVTNHDLEQIMDTSDQWIRERTGISERRIISEGETTTTLAQEACRKAMVAADVDPAKSTCSSWVQRRRTSYFRVHPA